MGKGAKPHRKNVVKPPILGGLIGNLMGDVDNSQSPCHLRFKAQLAIDEFSMQTIAVDTEFVLTPDGHGSLWAFSGNKKIGVYKGKRLAALKRCMGEGYIYGGKVLSVDGDKYRCLIGVLGVDR